MNFFVQLTSDQYAYSEKLAMACCVQHAINAALPETQSALSRHLNLQAHTLVTVIC